MSKDTKKAETSEIKMFTQCSDNKNKNCVELLNLVKVRN